MKKYFFLLLLLGFLMPLFPLSAKADSFPCQYTVTDGEVTIKKYTGSAENVVIPDSLGGYPVTKIGNGAFMSCLSLKSVTIPSSVVQINFRAFYQCKSLESVTFNEGLKTIDSEAFRYCTALKELILPEGVETVHYDAFKSCFQLTKVSIPASLSSFYVENQAPFGGCLILEEIKVSPKNQWFMSIDGVLFSKDGTVLIQFPSGKIDSSYTIPSMVTTLAGYAFGNCNNLSSLTIPAGVTHFDAFHFSYCEKLTSAGPIGSGCAIEYAWTDELPSHSFYGANFLSSFTFSPTFSSIGPSVFGNTGLTSITIPGHIKTIERAAFCGCEKLTKVIMKEGVVSIGDVAFFSSKALSYVKIPNSVTSIASDAFSYQNYITSDGTIDNLENVVMYVGYPSYAYEYAVRKDFPFVFFASVTIQPKDLSVEEDSEATFDFSAFGTDVELQWYYKKPGDTSWSKVSAASGKTQNYSFKAAYRHNGYRYRCKVWNSGGTVYTSTVKLTVIPHRPTISAQPKNISIGEGKTAVFEVAASATVLKYQWYYKKPGDTSWTAVKSKGTSASYTLATELRHDGYKYRCRVYNAGGGVYTKAVTLRVLTKPAVTTQPADKTVYEGVSVSFKVAATGGELSYQWYYKKPGETSWTAVKSGGTSASYTLTAELRHNSYKYRCKVRNSIGSVITQTVLLTVKAVSKPSFTAQPEDLYILADQAAVFKVKASGGGLSYQWYCKGPDDTSWSKVEDGGTSASYSLKEGFSRAYDGYQFRCKVKNNAGTATSKAATLRIVYPPSIGKGHYTSACRVGSTAEFFVEGKGLQLSYQWYYLKPGETTWRKVSTNGTSAVYSFRAEARHDGYTYHCVVKNAAGSVTSSDMVLEVFH